MSERAGGSPANTAKATRAAEAVNTPHAPGAIGPYTQAQVVRAGELEWRYTAGQVGLDPQAGELVAGGAAEQARQCMANLRAVLQAAGFVFDDVVKTTIFLADMADFQDVNRIYGEAMAGALPARSTMAVAGLPRGARVEIELVCVRRVPATA
jgi:2-iminobutanoate/2-iminopropanoate deaminase